MGGGCSNQYWYGDSKKSGGATAVALGLQKEGWKWWEVEGGRRVRWGEQCWYRGLPWLSRLAWGVNGSKG